MTGLLVCDKLRQCSGLERNQLLSCMASYTRKMCVYNEDWICITLFFQYRREVTSHYCYTYWHSKVHPCYVWIQEMCQHIFLSTVYVIFQQIPTCYDWFGMHLKCFMSIIYWLPMEHLYCGSKNCNVSASQSVI